MSTYEQYAFTELGRWKKQMRRRPSLINKLSKKMQVKVNKWIPEKIHAALTTAIKQMVRAVLFGATYTTVTKKEGDLATRESLIKQRIDAYKKTAAAEGGVTGAGGILTGLADFPLLLGIKMKMLFDIASLYGFDVKDHRERLYILHVFQLAFSSQQHRREIFKKVEQWPFYMASLPATMEESDWRSFQQEYRDYIDIAKMLQLIPGIGAVVGIIANYRLVDHLGKTAMNAYRLRWQQRLLQQ